MRQYIIKRLLVMIPTFVGISLVIFLVMNLAPGHPGGTGPAADLATSAHNAETQESHRIFREQFNLDKPVLFNTYIWLDESDIRATLEAMGGRGGAKPSDRVRAQERLEDWGPWAVPHLIRVLGASDDEALRDLAVYGLRLAARRPLVDPFARDPSPALREENRQRRVENQRLGGLRYPLDADPERKREVAEGWAGWFAEVAPRYEHTPLQRARIFFLETRFAKYWENLLRLDFGVSLVTREPVMDTLISKLRYSLSLSITSLLLGYLISIPLGIHSAVHKDTFSDRLSTVTLFMLYSLPSFFVGTLLLFYFSTASDVPWLRWFPIGGWRSADPLSMTSLEQMADVGWHLVLPVLCMTYGSFAALSRYMRTGLLGVIRSDYVRTARAKGLPESAVVYRHAVRNGLLPVLTLLAGLLPAVLGGSVIIEVIFGIPGMGLWMIDSIYQRDYNVIMAVQLLSTLLVLIGILLSDLSYALVDPRIRYS